MVFYSPSPSGRPSGARARHFPLHILKNTRVSRAQGTSPYTYNNKPAPSTNYVIIVQHTTTLRIIIIIIVVAVVRTTRVDIRTRPQDATEGVTYAHFYIRIICKSSRAPYNGKIIICIYFLPHARAQLIKINIVRIYKPR